jgi:hypothetical protein
VKEHETPAVTRAGFYPNRPVIEIADVLRRHGADYTRNHAGHLGRVERRVMSAITVCRTGGARRSRRGLRQLRHDTDCLQLLPQSAPGQSGEEVGDKGLKC